MNIGFVIGNGGSLADMPLDFLNRYPSIGSNHIFLLDGFTPTYYTAVDGRDLMTDYEARLDRMHCIKFIGTRVWQKHKPRNVIRFETGGQKFAANFLRDKVCEGWSVTFVNLQLAYYLKWDIVLLVGVDHWSRGRVDHFTPNYYDKEYEIPPLKDDLTLPYFEQAKRRFEYEDRKIINITPGTALHVFEKEDWQSWQ